MMERYILYFVFIISNLYAADFQNYDMNNYVYDFIKEENKIWAVARTGLWEIDLDFDTVKVYNDYGQKYNCFCKKDDNTFFVASKNSIMLFNKENKKFEEFISFEDKDIKIFSLAFFKNKNLLIGTDRGFFYVNNKKILPMDEITSRVFDISIKDSLEFALSTNAGLYIIKDFKIEKNFNQLNSVITDDNIIKAYYVKDSLFFATRFRIYKLISDSIIEITKADDYISDFYVNNSQYIYYGFSQYRLNYSNGADIPKSIYLYDNGSLSPIFVNKQILTINRIISYSDTLIYAFEDGIGIYTGGETKYYNVDEKLFGNRVNNICINDDKVYISQKLVNSRFYGLSIFDLKDNQWERIYNFDIIKLVPYNDTLFALSGDHEIVVIDSSSIDTYKAVRERLYIDIAISQQDSILWLVSRGGIYSYYKRFNTFMRHSFTDSLINFYRYNNNIIPISDKKIYMGSYVGFFDITKDDGVYLYNSANSQMQADCVDKILLYDDGSVFIGTKGGGLYRYKNHEIEYIDLNYRVQNPTINYLYKDEYGILWVSVYEDGIYYYDGANWNRLFTEDYGFNENKFTAIARTGNNLFLGTSFNGLYRINFNLTSIAENKKYLDNKVRISLSNYPNPCNDYTKISINVSNNFINNLSAKILISNLLGQIIFTDNLSIGNGNSVLEWNIKDNNKIATGTYICTVLIGKEKKSKLITVIK